MAEQFAFSKKSCQDTSSLWMMTGRSPAGVRHGSAGFQARRPRLPRAELIRQKPPAFRCDMRLEDGNGPVLLS